MLKFAVGFLLGMLSLAAAEPIAPIRVIPRETDPAIGRSFNTPHFAYVNRVIVIEKKSDLPADRHQLLVFLPGTNGQAAGAKAFCQLGAQLGYHVINLMYPDDIPASVCEYDRDPKAFEDFRMAVIQGGRTHRITVAPADSIENRLEKLLLFLKERRPAEAWGQFLNADGTIKWEAIAIAGQSQGGGHAALIAIKHRVARVLCFGSPKDYSQRLSAPAAWCADTSATPKAAFFAFNHLQDAVVSTPQEVYKNLGLLGLTNLGPPVDVATEAFPYHHTHILMTSYPVIQGGRNSDGAKIAHTSVIATANAERWQPVWTYMLTENVP